MESIAAIKRLSALAQDSRLAVFRLLVKAGPDGIGGRHRPRFGVHPQHSIDAAQHSGDRRACQESACGRSIIYAASYGGMSERTGDVPSPFSDYRRFIPRRLECTLTARH
jgi:ArsR family transcriptional regulator